MQNDIAIFMLTGELHGEPDAFKTERGTTITTCLIKVLKGKFNEETKKFDEGADYDIIKFKCFGYLSNYVNKYCKMGDKLTVAGKPSGSMHYNEKYGESNFTDLVASKVITHGPSTAQAPDQEEVASDQHYKADMAAKEQPPAKPAESQTTKQAELVNEEWDYEEETTPVDPDDIPM